MVYWNVRQRNRNLPILEFSTKIKDRRASRDDLLLIAIEIIMFIEMHGGIPIPPHKEIPRNKSIFFEISFKTFQDLNRFMNII